jgi:hypothetical protein
MNGSSPTAVKPKRPLSMDILFIGVISLLAVGSWVIFDVYRAFTKTTVPKVLQKQIRPLESKIDTTLFTSIKSRRQFDDTQLDSVHPKAFIPFEERKVTPTPTRSAAAAQFQLVATPTASPTAILTPSPLATQSSQINL